MELVHTLNGVVIDEPIGFDSMKTTIKRHEYHGMSAEVTVGELEFYGVAATMIKEAYNTDIDTELTYKVQNGSITTYSGVIDLATYSEHNGSYFSVSCKVGEVGVKTTFNNRTEVEVDLNSDITLDGNKIAHPTEWNEFTIPYKTIQYINEQKQTTTTTYKQSPATGNTLQLPDDFTKAWLNISLDTNVKNEFGEMQPTFHISAIEGDSVDGYSEPFCKTNTGTDIDEESDITIDISLSIGLQIPENPSQSNKPFENITDTPQIEVVPVVMFNGQDRQEPTMSAQIITNDNYAIQKDLTLNAVYTVKKKDLQSVYIGVEFTNRNGGYNNPSVFYCSITQGSYIRVTLISQAKDKVSAPLIFIYDALNKIVESITDNALTVDSRLYNIGSQVGDGALKAITNGYKIRGLYSDENNERNMPISFKNIIENLNSIDCIGWGFYENKIVVENWDWFYQNQSILQIHSSSEIKRQIDDSLIITELEIGYKKYATSEDISSIDSIHGERTFTSTTKALSNSKSVLCGFIADNYAIEETRRAALTVEQDEEFKYDENIFILSLQMIDRDGEITYIIPRDIIQEYGSTLKYPQEVYNALISPTRNAFRWINRLFCVNGIKPFKLTKGTINYMAIFETKQSSGDISFTIDGINSIPLLGITTEEDSWQEYQNGENMSLQERYYATIREDEKGNYVPQPSSEDKVVPRVFKAEELSLTYPITREEYQAIMANPYGLVVVDGEECWIKEMTYDHNTGEAEFKLTPKAK